MVLDATDADLFLVPVFGEEAGDDPAGQAGAADVSLALVEANASGVSLERLRTIDRTRGFGELVFEDAPVCGWLGERGAAGAVCQSMLDAGRIILAADLLGASERAIELAVAYAMERRQFDRVIASFQAVKHLCAEMVAELEPARSLVWYAAHAFEEVPEEASLMASHAKAHLSDVGHQIVRTATEVHGGIGDIRYPLVADLTKKISRDFGVLFEDAGVAFRGTFLIDREGVVKHAVVNDLGLGRNIDETVRMVRALRHHEEYGEVCPANWQEGQDAMTPTAEGVSSYLAKHNG